MTPEISLSATSSSARFIGEQAQSASSPSRRIKEFLDYLRKQFDASAHSESGLSGLLAELEFLRVAEDDEEGYIFKSEPRASENAKAYLIMAYREMRDFPHPKIESDGEGGIVFDWRRNGKIIRLACRAKPNQRDYIYEQDIDRHIAKDASNSALLHRLSWLMQDA